MNIMPTFSLEPSSENQKTDTSEFLYESVTYNHDRYWFKNFDDCLSYLSPLGVSWDLGAILSIINFGYAGGNSTLLKEVKRKPWLSKIDREGNLNLLPIPPHSLYWTDSQSAATHFKRLLEDEIAQACQGRNRVYILLSGGLDSRVVAGITASLAQQGKVTSEITAVTWGLTDSRDVHYARKVAQLLGLEWLHVDLSPEHLLENIDLAAFDRACLVTGNHLHRMHWFRNVKQDAVVLSGSYGDSVSRAEFSQQHLLELKPLRPSNPYGLFCHEAYEVARNSLENDLRSLYRRVGDSRNYVLCELEMQGHYMRGLIAHAMDIINNYCTVYYVYTAPQVFSFTWSLHPSCRNDKIYAHLLNDLDHRLLHLPWSRTNSALVGKTVGRIKGLRKTYTGYPKWVSGDLFETLYSQFDIHWLLDKQIFDRHALEYIVSYVRKGEPWRRHYEIFIWLVQFCKFGKLLELKEVFPKIDANIPPTKAFVKTGYWQEKALLTAKNRLKTLNLISCLLTMVKRIRKTITKLVAIIRFLPQPAKLASIKTQDQKKV